MNHGLPPHLAQKGRSYYYGTNDKPRRWLPHCDDYRGALAGHTSRTMNERYVKQRAGARVAPNCRKKGAA